MKFVSASISDEAWKVNGTAISKKWTLDTLAFCSHAAASSRNFYQFQGYDYLSSSREKGDK